MHIPEDSSESSGGSTPTCTSSSSYMEPGALYVQMQPSGKPAFVRRSRRYKTPGSLLADALFNPRPIVQKHSQYQAPDTNRFEPASPPEPQQIPVPSYEQFLQYPPPQQHPIPNPLASFPNDMAQNLVQITDPCEASFPKWEPKIGKPALLVIAEGFCGHCSTRFPHMCCHSCDCRRRRRNRDYNGSKRGCDRIARRNDCGCTREDSCMDSSSESDVPVKKHSHKHKRKGKGRNKSFLKKSANDVSDSSDEEGQSGRVRFREPVRPDRHGANRVGSGIYDPRTGTVHHANRTDGTGHRPVPTVDASMYANQPTVPTQQNLAYAPGYYPPHLPPHPHPDSNAAIPTYQPSHRPAPEWAARTYYDDDRRNYESNTDGEVADSRSHRRRRRGRSPTPTPIATHDLRYPKEERMRSPGRVNVPDTYYDPPDTPYHSDYHYVRPRSPDRYERYPRDPPRERSYSRRRPVPGSRTPGPHSERPRVVEMRRDRRPDELDPPTRPRRGY
ncbi:uncharacterized protein BDCG_08532 [Blastomyces dermatitidis ER-3]|uniref:Uncharacterized protein n=4 Tax=Ajellomyces dermatitidis TaxID=5039 RepID=F2T5A0_AJEDA|nr:uncharacterized protein BDCG_08532 [Blastomyces dermatitidis ER-3]EGE78325.2 hypothetical protein BDDG_01262 [Blastomyces dermatitidis ATCC 18188]OAT02863.1 hypothetical protein BDCG_08532 [Blastomyces dermatitidis ER-3]